MMVKGCYINAFGAKKSVKNGLYGYYYGFRVIILPTFGAQVGAQAHKHHGLRYQAQCSEWLLVARPIILGQDFQNSGFTRLIGTVAVVLRSLLALNPKQDPWAPSWNSTSLGLV